MDQHREAQRSLPDVVCLSHLRWNFVFQRPQHLLSRFARERRVFFFEEPVWEAGEPRLSVTLSPEGVHVATPHLPHGLTADEALACQRNLLDQLMEDMQIEEHVLWVYTPMALPFARHLRPAAVVYDCMDQLSAFKGAPPELMEREAELIQWADLVFTGGQSLYEAKRDMHPSVHAFPSSVDVKHFAHARDPQPDPADQAGIPHPRFGFFGVVDERMDVQLLGELARARPDWHFVVIGPVVKIDPATLPHEANIHYLGGKKYEELPSYIAGWDVALMPFARNESTRFISPTKTPEYLAAGRPVVSTSIRDVVRPYGERGLVRIADDAQGFVKAIEELRAMDRAKWLVDVDAMLANMSWDATWRAMADLVNQACENQPAQRSQTEDALGT